MATTVKDDFPKNTALFTITHNRKLPAAEPPSYILQAGAKLGDKIDNVLRDDTGENISKKNREFCELTALYWIWKNDKHEIIGLNHYRRQFAMDIELIPEILTTKDIIAPRPYYFRWSLVEEYCRFHEKSDLLLLMKLLKNYKSINGNIIRETFSANQLVPYNMFIAPRDFIEQYCEWLFPILSQLEAEISMEGRSLYQRRVFGFLAERLFTFYLHWKKSRVYWCPVYIPERKSFIGKCKYTTGQLGNRIVFKMNHLNIY